MEDEEFEGEILEYFEDEYQEYWRNEIRRGEWDKAENLSAELEDGSFIAKYGENSKLFMLCDGESLLSFCAYCEKSDFAENIGPCADYLFTFPSSRNKGYAEMLLNQICEEAANNGKEEVFVKTELSDYFTKRGFEIIETFSNNVSLMKKILK